MDLSTALEKTVKIEDEYNGEAYWFEVRDEVLTQRFLQQAKDWDSEPILKAQAMSEVITAWDVEMNGEPFPPTAENLARVPSRFLNRMIDKMAESWQGNPQKPSESAST